MSLYLFDTDHLSLYQTGHPQVVKNVLLHLADRLAISVISVEEQLTGWQRALRHGTPGDTRDSLRRTGADKGFGKKQFTHPSFANCLLCLSPEFSAVFPIGET